MKIAQIAPLMESVPPRLYGGTERIVSHLTEELMALGHDVTLFASGASLGLEFNPDRNEILLRKPQLPSFLDEVTLHNLRLGNSAVDLRLRRHGTDVSLQVLRNEGQIMVASVYS